jgi:hypothetical protein
LNRSFAAGDRFTGAGEVMPMRISRLFTGCYRPFNRLLEVPPLAVAEQRLQVTSAPVFGAMLVGFFRFSKDGVAMLSSVFLPVISSLSSAHRNQATA